ncbi:thiamine biosynthesis lipoprotein ApbE [Listeria weihenstephanensis FSL R9-0317]|uniref:FAD:protein FMN transferase n=1 Tax=Listeria weihenstephanensis TaxID=1006155 RepID=A0A1S7FRC0_9LIST|nr:FAD:protein FMN transferase [Listeria weihenstephanensis]AQY49885.1 thiamine biosynthesis protein ApbE [Listeria weihenstephanensis]EUJ39791.1 thiamine biosynthesis lipoprotein ApbE [Listeria weihenstephanensis FSL R9-0317]
MKKFYILLTLVLLAIVATACGNDDTKESKTTKESDPEILSQPYTKTDFLMGTINVVKIYDKGKESVLMPAFDRIKELDAQITTSDSAKKSEVDKVNLAAGKNPVKVNDDVFYLIKEGLKYSASSDGSFDITIGPLTSLWHIGFDDAKKPTQAEIDAVLPLIDYKKVKLDEGKKTVYLEKAGMELDLGAIAKGYIADEVEDVLDANKVTTAIIDLGGNIIVKGDSPKGGDWMVGIQDPFSSRGTIIGTIPEANKSIVTSGIYERFLEVDGVKYHHILDPDTGYPFDNDIAGVSIVSEKSIDGDGLSTATFSKGIKGGMEFIEKYKGVEAIFVSKEKKVYETSGLKGKFKLTDKNFQMAN